MLTGMFMQLRIALVFLAAGGGLYAQKALVAPTPPMGWNSWDAYGLTITESQFRENAAVLREKLLPFGWNYAVIDEGWFLQNPQDRPKPETLVFQLDGYGRYVPVPDRFPSSAPLNKAAPMRDGQSVVDAGNRGFVELGRWVHAQGLKFGIHIVRGIPRESVRRNLPIENSPLKLTEAANTSDACPWDPTNWGVQDNAAGQAWYDSLMRQYAGWGVDLLKVDCISDHPYKASEIRQIRRAIDKAGRSMVLSLSPGPTQPSHAEEVASLANMWRISDDFWDVWQTSGGHFPQPLKGQFDRLASWAALDFVPGQWPDADMLPFGELRPSAGWGQPRSTRLTPDEQRTVMTLWAINQSPLILGANLTLLDDATLRLLTNRNVLRLDQAAVRRGRPVAGFVDGDLCAWTAQVRGDERQPTTALALFNLSDRVIEVDRLLTDLGVDAGGKLQWTDAWTGKTMGRARRVQVSLPPHGSVLLEGRP